MPLELKENEIVFEGLIDEHEVEKIREHLQKCSPLKLTVSLKECTDMHTAIIQLIGAYHCVYGCEFIFPQKEYAYTLALRGIRLCDNDTN